jgi:hypothetical protein
MIAKKSTLPVKTRVGQFRVIGQDAYRVFGAQHTHELALHSRMVNALHGVRRAFQAECIVKPGDIRKLTGLLNDLRLSVFKLVQRTRSAYGMTEELAVPHRKCQIEAIFRRKGFCQRTKSLL